MENLRHALEGEEIYLIALNVGEEALQCSSGQGAIKVSSIHDHQHHSAPHLLQPYLAPHPLSQVELRQGRLCCLAVDAPARLPKLTIFASITVS